jgi:hypothetical protein
MLWKRKQEAVRDGDWATAAAAHGRDVQRPRDAELGT